MIINTKVIGPWTIPPSRDWSDRGGKYRAVVEIKDGHIISARLEVWAIVRRVCFGRNPRHERSWIPCHLKPWISTTTHDGPRNPNACESHWHSPNGMCYDCLVVMSQRTYADLAKLR